MGPFGILSQKHHVALNLISSNIIATSTKSSIRSDKLEKDQHTQSTLYLEFTPHDQ